MKSCAENFNHSCPHYPGKCFLCAAFREPTNLRRGRIPTMPKKEYSLLSIEPLTEFDNFMLRGLQEVSDCGVTPRAALIAVLNDEGNIGTFYHQANLSDMILMRGFIDLDIHTEYLAANAPLELEGEEYFDDEEGEGG